MEQAMLAKASELVKHPISKVSDAIEVLDKHKVKFSDVAAHQGQEFTLKSCIASVLVAVKWEEEEANNVVRLERRFRLSAKIWGAAEPISLKADDIKLIQELLERAYNKKIYNALIVGQALALLESEDDEEGKKLGEGEKKEPKLRIPKGE
jgi:hypothetical protein